MDTSKITLPKLTKPKYFFFSRKNMLQKCCCFTRQTWDVIPFFIVLFFFHHPGPTIPKICMFSRSTPGENKEKWKASNCSGKTCSALILCKYNGDKPEKKIFLSHRKSQKYRKTGCLKLRCIFSCRLKPTFSPEFFFWWKWLHPRGKNMTKGWSKSVCTRWLQETRIFFPDSSMVSVCISFFFWCHHHLTFPVLVVMNDENGDDDGASFSVGWSTREEKPVGEKKKLYVDTKWFYIWR